MLNKSDMNRFFPILRILSISFLTMTVMATTTNFRFDGYAARPVSHAWKTVEMENDFIKVSIFPEIGGKIWEAVEKSTGKEFIYYNHAVKFRDIAMRGAWTSGGIEFNFGIIGHVPTSATPVDYLTRTNEDGSVSCFISSTELLTRTTWTVEVNLPGDKAYFTTRTTWSNTSQVDQPYYQWMNAGYKASGNLQFCYPGQYYIGHGGDVHAFPVNEEGRDISWYKKNNFGADKSYHVLGEYNDFYGAYWHDDNFGSVHHAPYNEILGMKIFLWGLSREGGIWEDLLTDTDGQYVELQSGCMFNQSSTASTYTPYKHFSFIPGTTDEWTEFWFPVKETGGLSKVSQLGSLHAVRHNGQLEITFNSLRKIESRLSILSGDKIIHTEPLRLNTMKVWKKSVPLPAYATPVSIVIGDKELVWNEAPEKENLNRPVKLSEDFDWDDTYGLYVSGEQLMNQKINAIRSIENSKDWIENLGVGKPYEENIDTRLEDFMQAIAYEKLNEPEKAASLYRKGRFSSSELLTAMSLRKTSRTKEADTLAESWLKDDHSRPVQIDQRIINHIKHEEHGNKTQGFF